MHRTAVFTAVLVLGLAVSLVSREPASDPRVKKAVRQPAHNGWIFVHLEGSPAEIGYQHGYLLAPEIKDNYRVLAAEMTHDEKNDWEFFRKASREVLWPKLPDEYKAEIDGIVEGLKARGVKLDRDDITAMNGSLELPYYSRWRGSQRGTPASSATAEHCSAFVATGSYTKDGRPVIAHNNWTSYGTGTRWNIIFDIAPASGHRFIMDGMPGLIHSGDDFGINAAGIMITETTISRFIGFNPDGAAEFGRARRAMQYAASVDDFTRIMSDGNNGGYANDWLVADRNTGEVASVELGLKNVNVQRTKDGYFAGSNYPIDPKLNREEAPEFDVNDMSLSPNARRVRWHELIEQNKGKIDVAMAQRFLADHFDTYTKRDEPNERSLDGHIDLSPRGSEPWQPPYGPAGAVQNKAADSAMAARLTLSAALGHACGMDFKAAAHIKAHPEFAWEKATLRDMNAHPWTVFSALQ